MAGIGGGAEDRVWTRRTFVSGLTAAAALAASIPLRGASGHAGLPATRDLAFRSLHTGEELQATYVEKGRVVVAAMSRINRILRDWRTDEVYPIDLQLLDMLAGLRGRLGTDAPFEVISGYRSPKTNAKLASKSNGVAKRSLHMRGMAIDISVPGCSLDRLHREALALKAGGVGLYSGSGFIHVDTGHVRNWGG